MVKKGGNPENFAPLTTEEARKRGRAGGIASAKARQARKSWKETAEIVLKMSLRDGKVDSISGIESIKSASRKDPNTGELVFNLTVQDHILLSLAGKASKGDVKAIELLRDILGEQPAQASVSPLEKLAETIDRYKDEEEDDD